MIVLYFAAILAALAIAYFWGHRDGRREGATNATIFWLSRIHEANEPQRRIDAQREAARQGRQ